MPTTAIKIYLFLPTFLQWHHCMVPIVPIQHTVTEVQNDCHSAIFKGMNPQI